MKELDINYPWLYGSIMKGNHNVRTVQCTYKEKLVDPSLDKLHLKTKYMCSSKSQNVFTNIGMTETQHVTCGF